MQASEAPPARRQSLRFLWLYALAVAGGAVSYVPFLTLLLPVRAESMTGDGAINLLAYCAFAGASAASLANIGFGWASDRTGTRRPWIIAGLALSCSLLVSMPVAPGPMQLVGLIVLWQVGLNMMLGPLSAWAGDAMPPVSAARKFFSVML